MTLNELNQTAFAKYLLSQETPELAAAHMLECLMNGQRDSLAWDLMEAAHGKHWQFLPDQIPAACMQAIYFLKVDSLKNNETDPDEYDDSKDIKAGNNSAGLSRLENLYDLADEKRKRDKGE